MVEWKPIEGYDGLYEISTEGDVRKNRFSFKRSNGRNKTRSSKILSRRPGAVYGEPRYALNNGGDKKDYPGALLMAETFLGKMPYHSPVCIDGDVTNIRLDNIKWNDGNVDYKRIVATIGLKPDKSMMDIIYAPQLVRDCFLEVRAVFNL